MEGASWFWDLDWLDILVKRKALCPQLMEGLVNLNLFLTLGSTLSNPTSHPKLQIPIPNSIMTLQTHF